MARPWPALQPRGGRRPGWHTNACAQGRDRPVRGPISGPRELAAAKRSQRPAQPPTSGQSEFWGRGPPRVGGGVRQSVGPSVTAIRQPPPTRKKDWI